MSPTQQQRALAIKSRERQSSAQRQTLRELRRLEHYAALTFSATALTFLERELGAAAHRFEDGWGTCGLRPARESRIFERLTRLRNNCARLKLMVAHLRQDLRSVLGILAKETQALRSGKSRLTEIGRRALLIASDVGDAPARPGSHARGHKELQALAPLLKVARGNYLRALREHRGTDLWNSETNPLARGDERPLVQRSLKAAG